MLLNGVHLLPDLSGALIWPQRQLLAVADPIDAADARAAPQAAAEAIRRLATLARQRRPRTIVWLGQALPALLAAEKVPPRECGELARLRREHEWIWVEDELTLAPLTFRLNAGTATKGGEIIAQPSPLARHDGATWPAFIIDGRRLALPAFGPRPYGIEVMNPAFLSLFRRPFQAVMLVRGRIVTRARARLEPAP
ncbi:hypothetical protein [Magnetospirillum sulfuroxidans]|uniref:Metallo-beta-lactamase domain-containing protein n=1 Tax=Magnetospirillum sulfuroxidans TaxID=611300 RepID=A0ABS5I6T3_9PROT|nr:hypothetical protein [Magnetospirillum sulfuroxidans]MBR9970130.1 hypothetical protein [Magnetospirillum sulfuroxidans]